MKILVSLLFSTLLTCHLMGQTIILPLDSVRANPFYRAGKVVASQDLTVLQEVQMDGQSLLSLTVRRNGDTSNGDVYFEELSNETFGVPGFLGGNKNVCIQAGDVNGDGRDEICYAIENELTQPEMHCLFFQGNSNTYTDYNHISEYGLNQNTMSQNSYGINFNFGKMEIEMIDLNGDGKDEIALAYMLGSGLHVEFYSWSSTLLQLVPIGSLDDPDFTMLSGNYLNAEFWSICFDDFDYSGAPELVVCGANNLGMARSKVFTVNYNLDVQAQLACQWSQSSFDWLVFDVTTGDLNGDLVPEIITGSYNFGSGQVHVFGVGKASISDSDYVSSIHLYTNAIGNFNNPYSTGQSNPIKTLDIAVSDINDDNRDDIVISDMIYTAVIYGNADLQALPTVFGNATTTIYDFPPIPHPVTSSFLHLADLNNDGDIQTVVVWNSYLNTTDLSWQDLHTFYFDVETGGQSNVVIRHIPYNGTSNVFNGWKHASCMADLNGDSYRIGKPLTYQMPGVIQPLIQLTPPPVHSDYDQEGNFISVFDCETVGCGFLSAYNSNTNNEVNIESEMHSAWSVEASVGIDVGFAGVEVSAELTAAYGENFSNKAGTTSTYTETLEVSTEFDDLIYCSIINYEVKRYPLIRGEDTVRFVTSVRPLDRTFAWHSSKDDELVHFLNLHEPGNILSFRPISMAPELFPSASSLYLGQSFSINENSSYSNSISFSNLTSSEVQEAQDFSIGASLSANVYGVSASLEGNYALGQMKTQSVAIESGFEFLLSYPAVSAGPYVAPYSLRSAIKWSESGMGMIDFLTQPAGESSGGSNFWTSNYNAPDPALNLPWLLDNERGLNSAPEKRLLSKSIWLTNTQGVRIFNPSPGDTVIIHTRVFNYGLQPAENVKVHYFIGHPDLNNIPLTDVNGNVFSALDSEIGPQLFQETSFQTVLPYDQSVDCRLYAAIDFQNELQMEVHESNNVGWILLGAEFGTCGEVPTITEERRVEETLTLYPNPTSNYVFFNSDDLLNVHIVIYDVSGQIILKQRLNTNFLDLSNLPSGVYCIHLTSDDFSEVHRIVKQ